MKNPLVFYKIVILTSLVSLYSCGNDQAKTENIHLIDYEVLEAEKMVLKNGNEAAVKNYSELIKKADLLLTVDGFSVVHKTGLPPSKNKHDYMSIGPYWWPNSKTENGLPYIRKDGEINPETRNNFTDFRELENFFSAVKTLKKAFYFSDDKKYALKNLEFISKWFIGESTRMNPNMNFGQSIPGKNDGRCFGIIEFGGLKGVIEFLELARDKGVLTKEIEEGMFIWLTEYSNWLKDSKLGVEEATRKNNHGTHYDVQLLSILVYLNKIDEVKNYLSTTTKARIFSQIEPDGSQPLELARTKSFSYSVMNLHGFLELAIIGKNVGVDLWGIESEDGRSLKKGYQYMLPFLTKEKQWGYKQIINRKHSEEKLISDLKKIRNLFSEDAFNSVTKVKK